MLAVLDKRFQGTAPSISEATAVSGTSRQNVKQVALQLERRGWLRVEPDPVNRRMLRLVLTHKRAVFGDPAVQADQAAFVLSVSGGLTSDERLTLLNMVTTCIAGPSSTATTSARAEGNVHDPFRTTLSGPSDTARSRPSARHRRR